MSVSIIKKDGYTLVELLCVITILLVVSYFGSQILKQSIEESQFDETRSEMIAIRNALVGNPDLYLSGKRSSFGYVGDIGGLPSATQGIQALISNPGLPSFSVDVSTRMGCGWNGPYLSSESLGNDLLSDGWGNPYVYTMEDYSASVLSYGADGVQGGTGFNQDLKVLIPSTLVMATIYGVIQNQDLNWNGSAEVEIFYPSPSGIMTSKMVSVVSGNNGKFSTSEIPFGMRSLKIYVPTKLSPSAVIGPVLFEVNAPHVLIPANHTKLNN